MTVSLKEKVIPKSLLFCLHLEQVNIGFFISPKFQPLLSVCYPEEILPLNKVAQNLTVPGSQAVFTSVCDIMPSNLKLAGSRKVCIQLGLLHKARKMYFFQLIIDLTIFTGSEQILLKIAQLRGSHNIGG